MLITEVQYVNSRKLLKYRFLSFLDLHIKILGNTDHGTHSSFTQTHLHIYKYATASFSFTH